MDMACRRALCGLEKVEPAELAAPVEPGTAARFEPANPPRNDLRDLKQATERGWRLADHVKDKAVETVYSVTDDRNASPRDRVSAAKVVTAEGRGDYTRCPRLLLDRGVDRHR